MAEGRWRRGRRYKPWKVVGAEVAFVLLLVLAAWMTAQASEAGSIASRVFSSMVPMFLPGIGLGFLLVSTSAYTPRFLRPTATRQGDGTLLFTNVAGPLKPTGLLMAVACAGLGGAWITGTPLFDEETIPTAVGIVGCIGAVLLVQVAFGGAGTVEIAPRSAVTETGSAFLTIRVTVRLDEIVLGGSMKRGRDLVGPATGETRWFAGTAKPARNPVPLRLWLCVVNDPHSDLSLDDLAAASGVPVRIA